MANASQQPDAKPTAVGQAPLSDSVLRQIAALQDEKERRTPAQKKMDSGLVHLAKKSRGEVISAETPNLEVDVKPNERGLVLVDLSADVSEELLSAITTAGGKVINQFAAFHAIRAELPVQAMEVLAAREDVKSIAPAALAITNVGSALSQGDRTHRADAVRALYGGSGAGLKIGVLSDGVNSLAASKASGNLNSLATFLPGQAGSGDEGTAMMEIIQDIVPDAQLIFATGVSGDTVMAANIIALQAAGCSVIVDDIGYFNESPFQDMVISQAVNTISAAGAMFFSSARNSGNKNDGTSGTWEGDFASAGAVAAPVTGSGLVHNFGGAAFNTVASGGSSRRVDFFWADPLGASANDYDVFILDSTGATVLRSSTNVQSGTQNAYEASGTLNIGERIVIVQRAGAANRFLHLDTGRAVLTISTQGSTRGHNAPTAPNGFSVAATNVANSPSPNVFVGGATNPVETFSSDGPRRMFYDSSGTAYTPGDFSSTGGTVFVKPDIAAADGVTTTVPGFTSFFGTSAAAPHAAAIAAMIKSYNPALTPAQIRTAMTSTALDIEAVGSDRDSGAGIVMAYQAVASLPALDDLVAGAASFTASGFVGGPFTPTSATYTLTNLGAVPVNWTAAKTQSFTGLSSTSGTLAPGANTTVTWSLDPTANALAVGNYADTLTVTNTATSFAITRPMTLTVIGYPEIVVEQPEGSGLTDGSSTVAYGNVLAGANLTKRFAIKNIGDGPMTLSGASINGPHASDFALGSFTATTVAPGQTAYLDVSFRPIFPNSKSAALHILSSDVDEASFDLALTGFGTTPGGPVMLARDINITPNGLSPTLPLVIGPQEFFVATTVEAGQELWRTDGTAAGTFMVKDITSGTGGSSVSGLTNFGGVLFFSAFSGINGQELWKSDGTAAGTVMVKDINPTVGLGSSPGNLTVIGSTLFFSANESTNGTELWKSDGTTAGTVLVANIAAGATSSSPANFRAVGSTLFFTANDAVNGVELWKSDGTAVGTVMVTDIVSGITSSSPANLTAVGGTLFFTVNDTVNGTELWKSDGTAVGTVMVKDINVGVASSSPASLVEFGGMLFFQANTVLEGTELWKSDGTALGTVLVKDILPSGSSAPTNFLNAGSALYFSAFEFAGRELWKTDGTAAGTVLVKDVFEGSTSSTPTGLTLVGSVFYFQASASGLGVELWKSDGTAAGTVMVKDISPGTGSSSPTSFANLAGTLIFSATDGLNGQELWKSDGTEGGTVQLIDGQPGSNSSVPSFFRNVNGTLYFSAFDGVNGTELWKSDGSVAGTVLVSNINPLISGSSSPGNLTNIGVTLYFSANDGTNGTELWKSDGTSPGTVMVSNINATAGLSSSPANLTAVGSTLFFSASDTTANGTELWKSDGTTAGTVLVLNINPTANTGSNPANLTAVGSTLFFTASDSTANGTELWKSDGTAGGTALVLNINPLANASSSPVNLTDFNGALFFAASDGTNGSELWKSDGTAGGTVLVKDINSGSVSSSPANMRVIGSTLFFTATTAANGLEVWKTDGTTAGTVMVADINPGVGSSSPSSLTVAGTMLYFAAITTANGSELWRTDGTAPGTVMVTDIVPGASGAGPSGIVAVNGVLYFSAFATATGRELWKSDGTGAGTVLVADIISGTGNSNPVSLTASGNLLFFDALGPNLGSLELFVIDTTPPEEIQVEQPVGTILADNAATIDIGSPALGGSAVSKTFTIKNLGTQTLTVTGVTGDGADIASFSFPTLVGVSIPAAGSTTFTVSLNPTSLGAKSAAIHIENTDGDENPFDIALTGTVIALPEIVVEQPAGSTKLDGSSTVAFGDSVLGVGLTKTFTISNVGSSALSVTSITVDGANSGDFVTPAFSGTVPNGSSVTFDVTFTPSTTGARAAVLRVNSDDADESSYDIMLVGIGSAPAGLLKLARDINQTGAGAGITSMVLFGGSAYFAATTADAGAELWKTDGTAAGTVMVKDILAGSGSSSPANFLVIGSTLYFSAFNGTNGTELWKSDGTSAGTIMVKDIFGGINNSNPALLTNVGGTLFFTASDSTANGTELWKSDGTSAGTVLVLNINPTANTSSTPTNLTAVGSTLFFSATDTTANGAELWKSDGTAVGTVMVLNINTTAGTGSSPANLTAIGSTLFFTATDATNGNELWKSDGTAAGTVIVKDIFAGTTGSFPAVLVNAGGTLFFRANTLAAGTELWKSDGTTVGTVQVKDIFSGGSSSNPASLFPVGPLVYFSATDGVNGIELWKSDGTTVGTVLVADINPGSPSSTPINFTLVGTTLYLSATTASGSTELWRTDGTVANTSLVLDVNPGSGASSPGAMVNIGGSLVFVANDGTNGAEIWRSDSTGTSLVRDLTPGSNSAVPALLTLMNGVVYFSSTDGVNGTELWRSDGTQAGTSMVKDISAGASSGNPTGLTVIGSTLYFAAFDATNGTELWKSDGTAAGTVLVANIFSGSSSSVPANLANVNGTLYFSATDGTNGAELWKSDGTAAGTVMVANINPAAATSSSPANLTDFNGTLFFTASDGTNGSELWKSDGTAAGTVIVLDINPGITGSSPLNLRVIGSTLYCTASTNTNGTELWKTDGTSAGTVMVSDINAGAGNSSPANLTVVGPVLFFSASNGGVNGTELWKSDGTLAGTVMVKDIFVGTPSSSPSALTNVNGILYFAASDVTNSVELWKSDGTAAGTVLVKDILVGLGGSSPAGLVNAYGTVYFRALTTAPGTELWKSDGTAAGTVLASDVRPGALSSTPANLTVVGGSLFFTATGPDTGTELWVYDLGVAVVAQEIQVEQPASTILADGVSTIDFGTTATGIPVLKTLTIRNMGTQNLTITGITGDGADIGSFSFPTLAGTIISGSSSTTFTVTFNPASAGSKTAAIHIASDDADENPFDINVSGTGMPPPPAPIITVSTAALAANATNLSIAGTNFDPLFSNNSVTLSNGAVGTVIGVLGTTTLNVQFTTAPTAGILTAVVTTTTGGSSGVPVQVATVVPVITANTGNLANNATGFTINGFGFSTTAGNNTVAFSPAGTGTVTAATATSLTVTSVTGLINGALNAIVTTNGVASASAQVATVVAPVTTVTAISPNIGITSGGASVTITGTNFTGATAVSFGGTAAMAFAVSNATTITATTPAHAAGVVDVVVTTPIGTGTGIGLFTYSDSALIFSNFMDATTVVGQADFTAQLTTASQTVTPSPIGCAISVTGKFAVAEQGSNRVLIWNSIPTSNGVPADVVVGKPDFTSTALGTTASITRSTGGVAFSPDGQKLIVSDGGNNRVLIWNSVPTTNGAPADVVIGQTDFVTSSTGTSATKFSTPQGVAVTPDGKLLVSDRTNNRVLVFNSIPVSNGAAADVVIGQADKVTATSGNTASKMSAPWGLAVTGDGRLLVADETNNRVLIFASVPTVDGASASFVIGQPGFGSGTAATTQTGLNVAVGVAVSSAGKVAIGDYGNHRVLIYNSVPNSNGVAADFVLGQPNFTSATSFNGGVSAHSMARPYQPTFASEGRLIVPGRDMRRAMIFGSINGTEIVVEQPAATGLTDGVSTSSFGTVEMGANTSLIYTVRNTGSADLTGLGITIDGANATDYLVTLNPTAPVVPAGTTTFTVRFAPTAAGTRTAALHIASNDADENPFDITLTGSGIVSNPEIVVEQPVGTNIPDGGSKSFGSVGTTSSASLTFTIRNTGTGNLNGLAITKDGPDQAMFTVTSSPVAPVTGPSGSTTFVVSFAPTSIGPKSAAIHIASNDADENPFDINLTGTGVIPSSTSAFYEGFEGPGFTNAGWSAVNATHATTFPTTGAPVGAACLSLHRISGSSTHYTGASATFTPSQPDYVSWRMRTPAINNTGYFVLGDSATTTNNGIVFAFFSGTTGALRFSSSPISYDYPGTLVDSWYHIELKNINWTTRTFDIWVNGTQVQTAFPFRSTTTSSLTNLYLYNFGTGSGLYDEIIIGTPPSSNAPKPVASALGDVVTGEFAPDSSGAGDGTQFGMLLRGGFLAQNGMLVFPGELEEGVGGVTALNYQGIWKHNGSSLARILRSGDAAEGAGGALFDVLPQVPGINDGGQITVLAALRPGTGVPSVTNNDDTGLWTEMGGGGVQLLLREGEDIPGLPVGTKVGRFGTGCFATAMISGTEGEAAFTLKMKGLSTDSAVLRASISGSTIGVGVLARENTAAGTTGQTFGNLNGEYTTAVRMDAQGNLVFGAVLKPSGKTSLWYQARGGALGQVFVAGDAAPNVAGATPVGSPTFRALDVPSMGDAGTIAFRGVLNLDGDNATNARNDGIWRGTAASGFTNILRRGDNNTLRPGLFSLAQLAANPNIKAGNIYSGWLTNNNRGAWLGWVDLAGNGISAYPADSYGIYTDLSGTMQLLIKAGDAAPDVAGATMSFVDHPIVGGEDQLAFIGMVSGGGAVAGVSDKGVWRTDAFGGTPRLVIRTGDTISTTLSGGPKTIVDVDLPGSNLSEHQWETPLMDFNGRLIVYVTFDDGTTSQVIVE